MSSGTSNAEPQKLFISDCEGPISKNDNAFELTTHFIPEGNLLFTLISRYDDILAEIVTREGYKAGDTLKLILPFLKAYGVTNRAMAEYSSQNIVLMPGAKETLNSIKGFMPSFIISTSYEPYMQELCRSLSFPFANVHCTQVDLSKYDLNQKEKARLMELKEEMVKLPKLEIPHGAKVLKDFPKKMQQVVQRLDEIFWKEIASMKIGRILEEINPVGGSEKAEAAKNIVSQIGASLQNVMYVGDSITDVAAFRLVRNAGGLTVSFNGNNFAVKEAEFAVLSENAIVTAVLAYVFNKFSKTRVLNLAKEWKPSTIEKFGLNEPLKKCFLKLCGRKFPEVEVVTAKNMERLMRDSTDFRKTVRGEAIGKLG